MGWRFEVLKILLNLSLHRGFGRTPGEEGDESDKKRAALAQLRKTGSAHWLFPNARLAIGHIPIRAFEKGDALIGGHRRRAEARRVSCRLKPALQRLGRSSAGQCPGIRRGIRRATGERGSPEPQLLRRSPDRRTLPCPIHSFGVRRKCRIRIVLTGLPFRQPRFRSPGLSGGFPPPGQEINPGLQFCGLQHSHPSCKSQKECYFPPNYACS